MFASRQARPFSRLEPFSLTLNGLLRRSLKMPAVIEFERVTKVYQGRQIGLADVSFALPAGSSIGLLGANGSGKSTAIRIALGLITPSAGVIRVFGEPM